MSKKILVTGTLGQDGANMSEFLLKEIPNAKVFGMIRRSANPNFVNCQKFLDHPNFQLVYGDLTDEFSISKLVKEIQPDYFINFAANSFVGCSWDMPMQIFDTNSLGVIRCLEALRTHQPKCRFYSAGSSEEFGDVDYSPQDMKHPLKPRSPYGASKCAARHMVKVYRESYDMFAVHGTLFNHEGTKRGEEFVTRKITKGVARIWYELKSVDRWRARHSWGSEGKAGSFPKIAPIELGNIYSKRDWSDSEDFVRGVWLILNQDTPKDYLLASGETHSIKEFVTLAFAHADISGDWIEKENKPLETKFVSTCGAQKQTLVKINEIFYRPAEVELLLGDPSEVKKDLNWKPKTTFSQLVKKMTDYDIQEIKKKT